MIIAGIVILQIIAFGVVILFLKKMMSGDAESAVNRLNQSYAEMNKKKEDIAAQIQEIEKEYQKRKEEAEKIANQIREKAEEEMRTKADALIKKSHEEAERIVADAMNAKDKIREELRKEEQMKMMDYCEDLVSLTFSDVLKEKIDALFIEDFLRGVEQLSMDQVPPTVNEIELVVSRQIDDTLKSKIEEIIKKKMQRDISCTMHIDQKILGGAIIKFGSLVLDGSIVSKLTEHVTAKKQTIEERR